MIEFSLLLIESVERLSEDSVREEFCEAKGKRRDEVEVGIDERSTIMQLFSCLNAEATWDHTEAWNAAKHRPK